MDEARTRHMFLPSAAELYFFQEEVGSHQRVLTEVTGLGFCFRTAWEKGGWSGGESAAGEMRGRHSTPAGS